jgi:membrane-bound ClpP family serine protease
VYITSIFQKRRQRYNKILNGANLFSRKNALLIKVKFFIFGHLFAYILFFLYLCRHKTFKAMTYLILTIILVVFGVGLLLAEMFLLPGFGIAGVFGLLSLVGAVVMAYLKLTALWAWAGHVTLAACVILCAIAIWVFVKSKAMDKMALDTKIEGGVDMPSAGKHMEELQK